MGAYQRRWLIRGGRLFERGHLFEERAYLWRKLIQGGAYLREGLFEDRKITV